MLKALSILLVLLSCVAAAKDLDAVVRPVSSPNGLLEVYHMSEGTDKDVNGNPYDYGTKLLLRRHGQQNQGLLLQENGRWMGALWSPDSRLVAIEDHWDGHASEIYVYKVTLTTDNKVSSHLVFHTPENAYDLKWFIEGWGPSENLLHLRREQRTNDGFDPPASWKNHAPVEHIAFMINS
jgi:hypothetical protein